MLFRSRGTVDIEAWIGGAWHVIHSEDVSSVGSIMIRDDVGHYEKIRANISAYTAGTHSVYATVLLSLCNLQWLLRFQRVQGILVT